MRIWYNGIITACHAVDTSSILVIRSLFKKLQILKLNLSSCLANNKIVEK